MKRILAALFLAVCGGAPPSPPAKSTAAYKSAW